MYRHFLQIPASDYAVTSESRIDENTLFLNIETTGLSYRNAFIFMIGTARLSGDHFEVTCLLAENRRDEPDMLNDLKQALKEVRSLVTFGGRLFSYRFLTERWDNSHGEDEPLFENLEMTDIQQILNNCRSILPLEDVKKRTVEAWLGIHRDHPMTGKELINTYMHWESGKDTDPGKLISHHLEDMASLIRMYPCLSYDFKRIDLHKAIIQGPDDQGTINIMLPPFVPFPKATDCRNACAYYKMEGPVLHIQISCREGKLRYFLPGPVKDYDYLPLEDQAVHKSVSRFVDKAHRRPATKETCYTTAYGLFLPIPENHAEDLLFKEDLSSKERYLLYDEREWKETAPKVLSYIQSLLNI